MASRPPSSVTAPPLTYDQYLQSLLQTHSLLLEHPYCIALYLFAAQAYLDLAYPDLAAGAAYKALLLSDAVRDDSDEYHERALEGLKLNVERTLEDGQVTVVVDDSNAEAHGKDVTGEPAELSGAVLVKIYHLLCHSLILCGCFKTAYDYWSQASSIYPDEAVLRNIQTELFQAVATQFSQSVEDLGKSENSNTSTWPNASFVRRECYPWNSHEPDRLNDLGTLNALLHEVAPRLEVRVVDLPSLTDSSGAAGDTISRQLGVFAKEDVSPGEVVLDETSLLTANNRLQDALCDACSADLPELDDPDADMTVSCTDCDVVFCSQACYDRAMEEYHPALCDMDVEAIAKDVPAKEAADSLYSLLLLRSLAMAETQECHPLDLRDIKYIWADFHNLPPETHWRPRSFSSLPLALPFSFNHNIRLPLHMLEKMDVDIFASSYADVWVFNTLYAKFRGTASARLSGRQHGSAIRGPEVSAVHFLWCLANHSCDPNVEWEWGGSIKFWVREERVAWKREDEEEERRSEKGLRKGEEVLNHYCDVDLPVRERREWARGALGGDCRCERCIWEAGE